MPPANAPSGARSPAAGHWDHVYTDRDPSQVSWYQHLPTVSLELIEDLGLAPADPVIDVGAGAGTLVDALLERGHRDLTVLDVSETALAQTRARLTQPPSPDGASDAVTLVVADLLAWTPPRRYQCWHDRAVFHFLTNPADQARYRDRLVSALAPGGYAVVGAFAADGPTHCSGLSVARYDPDSLAHTLDDEVTGLTPTAHRRERHITPDGRVQPFTWLTLHRPG